jgi:hypothetical protein
VRLAATGLCFLFLLLLLLLVLVVVVVVGDGGRLGVLVAGEIVANVMAVDVLLAFDGR